MRRMLGILMLVLSGCGCENRVLHQAASLDGRRTAVLFDRECGAAVGPTLEVSVLDGQHSQGDIGNALVMDLGQDTTLAHSNLDSLVRMNWLSPTRLAIAYDARLRVFKQNSRVGGVDVEYGQLKR